MKKIISGQSIERVVRQVWGLYCPGESLECSKHPQFSITDNLILEKLLRSSFQRIAWHILKWHFGCNMNIFFKFSSQPCQTDFELIELTYICFGLFVIAMVCARECGFTETRDKNMGNFWCDHLVVSRCICCQFIAKSDMMSWNFSTIGQHFVLPSIRLENIFFFTG